MKTLNKALVVVTGSMVSAQALAHTGHDHAASTSMLSHVAFYGSIAAALAFTAFVAVSVMKKAK